ncbi:MAG: bifunctional diguanylate cyclase/phosphodiesterase [Spirochaetaceae bacterium]|nr:bifunctional diguanylate cyclase/phosphodiesterase [Spirochaetaceae bacterium]
MRKFHHRYFEKRRYIVITSISFLILFFTFLYCYQHFDFITEQNFKAKKTELLETVSQQILRYTSSQIYRDQQNLYNVSKNISNYSSNQMSEIRSQLAIYSSLYENLYFLISLSETDKTLLAKDYFILSHNVILQDNETLSLLGIIDKDKFIAQMPLETVHKNFFFQVVNPKTERILLQTKNLHREPFHSTLHYKINGVINTQNRAKDVLVSKVANSQENLYVVSGIIIENTDFSIFMSVFSSIILFAMIFLGSGIILYAIIGSFHQKKIKKIINSDILTGGGNNVWFETEARKLINISSSGTYGLVILDIDRFKIFNDTFGHTTGDKALRYFYKSICSILSPGEIAIRSNSDNFSLLLKYHSPDVIRERLELLSLKLNSFNEQIEKRFLISVSCGVCQITDKTTDLLTIKDFALMAKASAKKTKEGFLKLGFFKKSDRMQLLKEKHIENKMENALYNKEFVVYLQPKYEIASNSIVGAEALIRWNDPEKGMIPPNEFIPLFEKNGFILHLDLFVFEQVCSTIRRWLDNGLEPITISVNLSRAYLEDISLLDYFTEIIDKYKIPPQYIEMELTETIFLENMHMLKKFINEIHKIGFTCSLDDFGSGYSSLNVLKNIPVDVLKLDKGFFDDIDENQEKGHTIIDSVINLAQRLNIKTVAEGVETENQVNFLEKAKCDMIQGYVFSKPIPISEFEEKKYGIKTFVTQI